VAALWLVFAIQLVYGARTDGTTDDELVYVGAGFRHLHGDFRINPEHPPLAKLLGALPSAGLDLAVPSVAPGEDQCGWSYRFVHEQNRLAPLLIRARLAVISVALALAALVWTWARRIGGRAAGLLALGLVAFQPAFLAHGHLITTDMVGTAAMAGASWCLWRFLQRASALRACLTAALVGLAVVARFTSAVLAPVWALLCVLHVLRARERGRAFIRVASAGLLHLLVVPIVIWSVYGFRHAPFPGDAGAYGAWPQGGAGRVLEAAAEHRVFPQPFVEGLRFQVEHGHVGHFAYLLGEHGTKGWWHYYLVVLVAKNTPGLLALLVAAAILTARGRASGAPLWHWLLPTAVILVSAAAGRIQIGERYILAVYPYLILWIAVTCAPLLASRRGRLFVAAALALHVLPAAASAPRGYLTFFNPLLGGALKGHLWLADSNLDWGQDLPRLAEWMKRRGVTRVQLGYFGGDDPDRHGIVHEDLPTWHSHHPVHTSAFPFTGTVVVSPNLLLGFLMPPGENPYDFLRTREPDDRVGALFVYELGRGVNGPRP